MSKEDKLIEELITRPKDFSYNNLKSLLRKLGYEEHTRGRTSGSAVNFVKASNKRVIGLHKPHPTSKNVPMHEIDKVIKVLKEEGDI